MALADRLDHGVADRVTDAIAADLALGGIEDVGVRLGVQHHDAVDQRLRATRQSRKMDPIEAAAEIADVTGGANSAVESMQADARLHGCINGLASHERAALRGAFFDGNTYEDLAARMKVPLGTMKSWIRRALIKLKACLEQ